MSANSFGRFLTMTTFGESHGPALGVVIDGVPPGLVLDVDAGRVIAKEPSALENTAPPPPGVNAVIIAGIPGISIRSRARES